MATTTLLTWEQFEQLPKGPGKRELLNGELIELPPVDDDHNEAAHRILFELHAALREAQARCQGLRLSVARVEKGYQLSARTWLQPDVSVTHAGQAKHDYMEGSPAIAIEVVSPANTPRALAMKTRLYFEFGGLEVWHFYPDEGHVVVHVSGADPVVIRDFLRTPLLPGFALNV